MIGQAILDYIMADRYDPVYGQMYPALNCINNDEIAERCKVIGAPKVIYAFKASARSNNDMITSLRSGFQGGYINLLLSDSNIDDKLSKIRGYSKLSESQQIKLRLPYVQTTMLVDELINLDHEISGGLIKVKEKTGMRKDRYSSLMYGYAVVQELGQKLKPKSTNNEILDLMAIKPIRKKR